MYKFGKRSKSRLKGIDPRLREVLDELIKIMDVTIIEGVRSTEKQQEYFNPVVLHYTTKGEQELAKSDEKYNDLIRDVDALSADIDPYSVV